MDSGTPHSKERIAMARKPINEYTLQLLRSHGYICDMTQRWIPIPKHPAGGISRDLYKFIDVVGILPGKEMIGVQCTSDANISSRLRKICDDPEVAALAALWLSIPNHRIVVMGWKKRKKSADNKTMVYKARMKEITTDMLTEERMELKPNTLFEHYPLPINPTEYLRSHNIKR